MDRIILKYSIEYNNTEKENDTNKKKNRKRMEQPFKMERDYGDCIRNTDNQNIQDYHEHWKMVETDPHI